MCQANSEQISRPCEASLGPALTSPTKHPKPFYLTNRAFAVEPKSNRDRHSNLPVCLQFDAKSLLKLEKPAGCRLRDSPRIVRIVRTLSSKYRGSAVQLGPRPRGWPLQTGLC